ncbi:hypothetical protein ACNQGP_15210 [Flavobacterium sp. GT2N3]|uniref:hypothetical protein n=1 Tax=unclassified Flavobacterium TaxID=196869 RepID=UPI003AB0EF75
MKLTIALIKKLGFEEISKQEHKTFERKKDKVTLYEWMEPIWLVQLDGWIGQYSNLMRVTTEEELEKAINERNNR